VRSNFPGTLYCLVSVATCITTCSCTIPLTNWTYTVRSLDGKSVAVARVLGLKPHRFELTIETPKGKTTPFTHDYGELYIGLCEIHWSADSRTVEVFATSRYEEPNIMFAYDTASHRALTITPKVVEDIRQALAQEYSLSGQEDPLKWADTNEAAGRFIFRGRESYMTNGDVVAARALSVSAVAADVFGGVRISFDDGSGLACFPASGDEMEWMLSTRRGRSAILIRGRLEEIRKKVWASY
jgi:hypothetical protein